MNKKKTSAGSHWRIQDSGKTLFLGIILFVSNLQVFAQVGLDQAFKRVYDSAWKMKDVSSDKTQQLVNLMDTIANYSNDPGQIIHVLQMRAFLSMPGDVQNGLRYIRRAIKLTNTYKLHKNDHHLFYVAGALLKGSDLDSATYYLETSYHLSQIKKDSATMKIALTKMSFVAMEQGDYVKALQYLQTCEKFASSMSPTEVVKSRINRSHAMVAVGLEERAIGLTEEGIKRALQARYDGYETHVIALYGNQIESLLKLNKPLEAYRLWRKMSNQIPNVTDFPEYSDFKITIGELYLALDSPALALTYFKEVKSIALHPYRKLAGMFHSYGHLGDHQKQKDIAMKLIKRIPKLSSDVGKTKIYKIAAEAFEYLNMRDSAYHYHKVYLDNFLRLYSQRQVAAILQDDFNEQLTLQKANAALEKTILQSEVRYNQQRSLFLIAVAILFAFITVLLLRGYRSVRKFNSLLNQRVYERTAELSQKNQQLEEYAFINAHKLRGPVARILGLLNLAREDQHAIEAENLMRMLRNESESLDNIVRTITKAIEEKKVIGRKDI
jgi:tetratricopeptide (TPR) repeat protein